MISFKPPLPGARVARALAEVQRFLAHTGVKAVAGLSGSVGKSIHSQGVVVVVGDRVKGRGYLGGKEIQRRSIEAFLPQPGYALLKSHEQALLEEHGVNFAGCLEKSELRASWLQLASGCRALVVLIHRRKDPGIPGLLP